MSEEKKQEELKKIKNLLDGLERLYIICFTIPELEMAGEILDYVLRDAGFDTTSMRERVNHEEEN